MPAPSRGSRDRRMRLAHVLSLLLAIAGRGTEAATVYRWVDEQGQVHFGDRPGARGAETLRIESAPATPAATDRSERVRRLLDEYATVRNEREAAAARRGEEAAERKRLCAEARDRLKSYEEASSLYTLDAEGQRRYLDETGRATALAAARDEIGSLCR